MISKIIRTLVTIVLIFFPFWGGALLGKYTPYREGNSFVQYILIYCCSVFIASVLLFYITRRWNLSFEQPMRPGVILFFIGLIMLGVAGLSDPPDLSIKMLQHPEREHLRYALLLSGLVLFIFYFLDLIRQNQLQLKRTSKWIFFGMVLIATIEMIWEFSHHYLYPEGLRKWIGEGHPAGNFGKYYDNQTIITTAAFGRFATYTLIAWMSIKLYNLRKVNRWITLVASLVGILGIISAIAVFIYQFKLPKGMEFLIILFIPGITFILIYWIGVAMLTKKPPHPSVATSF